MQAEIVFDGVNQVMDEFVFFLADHKIRVGMADAVVDASESPPTRRSETVFGEVREIAIALSEFLKMKPTCQVEIEIGSKPTTITHLENAGTIEKTISSQGVRVLFWQKMQ